MFSIEFVFLFLAFSIPLVCTPGPGNIILAMSGARWGVTGTIPLIAGIDFSYIVFTLLIGFGMGELFTRFPFTHLALKYAGGAYLIYLSWKIWNLRPDLDREVSNSMGFRDGVVLTLFNPKAHLLMILMFSQFMKPGAPVVKQVLLLTTALALVNIPNHFVWSYAGHLIAGRMRSRGDDRTSNRVFSSMLLGVAVYILLG